MVNGTNGLGTSQAFCWLHSRTDMSVWIRAAPAPIVPPAIDKPITHAAGTAQLDSKKLHASTGIVRFIV
jgi:hypothetical protein